MVDHINAIQETLENGGSVEDEPEQMELLPSPLAGLKAMAEQPVVKRGRKRGGRNKRDTELVAYYQKLGYRTPMEGWLEIINTPVEALAEALGCTKGEAFDRQERARAALAPYVHQRRPIQLEGDGLGGTVNIVVNRVAGIGRDDLTLEGEPVDQEPQKTAIPAPQLDVAELDE